MEKKPLKTKAMYLASRSAELPPTVFMLATGGCAKPKGT